MRKIPTVFVRDPETKLRYVLDEVNPAAKWVLDGEGVATRKYDGTCVLVRDDGAVFARREVKAGKQPPPNFIEVEHDDATGKTVGWEPADQSGFAQYIAEAFDGEPPGTYELCGPKVQGNPEGFEHHWLVMHDAAQRLLDAPRAFDALREYLTDPEFTYEGIVWHHPDGRMAKLKKRDFPRESGNEQKEPRA